MQEKEFKIAGMSCHHCIIAVETELRDAGFEKFKVKTGLAKVKYDGSEESEAKIKTAIEEAGYRVVN